MWNERVKQWLGSVWAKREGKDWRRWWSLYRGVAKTGQNLFRRQHVFKAVILG